jgi:hypothetical protein
MFRDKPVSRLLTIGFARGIGANGTMRSPGRRGSPAYVVSRLFRLCRSAGYSTSIELALLQGAVLAARDLITRLTTLIKGTVAVAV